MPPRASRKMTGTWMLAGVSFTVTVQTKIEEEEGPFQAAADIDVPDGLQAGEMVWVNLYQSGGILYVTQVSADYSINLPMIQR